MVSIPAMTAARFMLSPVKASFKVSKFQRFKEKICG
jgi:hypothetical protein